MYKYVYIGDIYTYIHIYIGQDISSTQCAFLLFATAQCTWCKRYKKMIVPKNNFCCVRTAPCTCCKQYSGDYRFYFFISFTVNSPIIISFIVTCKRCSGFSSFVYLFFTLILSFFPPIIMSFMATGKRCSGFLSVLLYIIYSDCPFL